MGRPIQKETKLTFSKEHVGKQSGVPEIDSHRQRAGSTKVEKTGHNPAPSESKNIPINRNKS